VPWVIAKGSACPTSKPCGVFREGEGKRPSGDPLGCHSTRESARRHQAALYANEASATAGGPLAKLLYLARSYQRRSDGTFGTGAPVKGPSSVTSGPVRVSRRPGGLGYQAHVGDELWHVDKTDEGKPPELKGPMWRVQRVASGGGVHTNSASWHATMASAKERLQEVKDAKVADQA
jgi:hypothetical protein